MPLSSTEARRVVLEDLIFGRAPGRQRFTQDSPVFPEVWLEYVAHGPHHRVDLLLTPHRRSSAAQLLAALRAALTEHHPAPKQVPRATSANWRLATTGDTVAACLTIDELVHVALPRTRWWQEYAFVGDGEPSPSREWLSDVVGTILSDDDESVARVQDENLQPARTAFHSWLRLDDIKLGADPTSTLLWSVSRNRTSALCLYDSVSATKADASRRLFEVDGSGIRWAVIDSGIDARHQAFRRLRSDGTPHPHAMGPTRRRRADNHSRVVATYDFTRLRGLMATLGGSNAAAQSEDLLDAVGRPRDDDGRKLTKKEIQDLIRDLARALHNGRMLDWSVVGPLLRIPHDRDGYRAPGHPHGTHVAGILGADSSAWSGRTVQGMCPAIEIYDLRVAGDDGQGDEFSVLAALQFVRWLNRQKDQIVVHGANVSLALPHSVANFACGRTPVCEECERLVAEGTVVVAAAGNRGQAVYLTRDGTPDEGFRTLSITDPGNAEAVITVGATHRSKPHTYGVSYFSSRGPTGDGRAKPDLLAPGEKVVSAVPGDAYQRMDGTSMAAPHVSGAAALLLAQHRELVGQPRRVKHILCASASDLGRERHFQGHGMLDVLRALQSL